MFTAAGSQVGNGQVDPTPITGIADTGTALLFLPDNVVEEYYQGVQGARYNTRVGGVTFPCSSAASLPPLSIIIANSAVTIPPAYMNQGPTKPNGTTCIGSLQSSINLGLNIFGDVFLKACYVVFDAGNMQLGFASKNLTNV